jgi:hypothetical protein
MQNRNFSMSNSCCNTAVLYIAILQCFLNAMSICTDTMGKISKNNHLYSPVVGICFIYPTPLTLS